MLFKIGQKQWKERKGKGEENEREDEGSFISAGSHPMDPPPKLGNWAGAGLGG
jgi:hypothetical protein